MGKKRDYGLILSIGIIIAAGSYWFVKELPTDKIESYVDLLGDKLVELVPRESDKETLSVKYDELKNLVKEKEVEPENLEKMAAAIINLSNSQDTLSLQEAESLIEIAITTVAEFDKQSAGLVEMIPKPEKWENLQERLGTIHELDKKFQQEQVIIGQMPQKNYRVDNQLNIIIDSRERKNLENEAFIRKLEKEKRVVWMNDMVENLKKDLRKMETELADKNKEYNKNMDLMELKILVQPVIDRGIMFMDSLDIVSEINWDSLERKVEEELEGEHAKQKNADPSQADRVRFK